MKKILLLSAVAALTGCALQQKVTYTDSSARNVEPKAGAIVIPIIAKPELISKEKMTPYEFSIGLTPEVLANIEGWKRIALNNAAQHHHADVIIGALINVQTDNNILKISVSGWPARYVNFRPATQADTWMVPFFYVSDEDNTGVLYDKTRHIRFRK